MAEIVTPRKRECERCGRVDKWDPERHSWRIVTEDDTKRSGDPHCLHEWDINGTFNPLAE
jgi:hypothetical protein